MTEMLVLETLAGNGSATAFRGTQATARNVSVAMVITDADNAVQDRT